MTKIVFLGTPEFAVPILEKLIDSGHKPVAVFCAPDKPVGRKQILTPPPVKVAAQKHGISVYQPANSRELADTLKTISHDLIITAAYGFILPKEVLDAPEHGCLNVHPSLLPKYRGASPIQAAILNGDETTGVTIYKMDEEIDHGAIIANRQAPIANRKLTTPELTQELSELGAELLLDILPDWLTGKITPQLQDDSQASFTKIIKKEDGQINWQRSAKEIEQQIRAYTPWPSAYANLKNKNESVKIKILEAATIESSPSHQPGEIFLSSTQDLAIQTGSGALIVKKLQLEGGKPMSAADFLRGHQEIIGQILK